MRNRLALLTLFFGGVLFGTASCGKDEATGEDPSTGNVAYCKPCEATSDCASGNTCRSISGTVGVCAKASDSMCCAANGSCQSNLGGDVDTIGKGGSGGSGGSGGGGVLTAGKGGTGGSGGTATKTRLGQACVSDGDCVTDGLKCVTDSALAGQQGPAGGLCTAPCASNDDCLDFASSAYCYPLGTEMYCIEGCPIGPTSKCHDRDNVACAPLTNEAPCTDDAECGPDGVCDADNYICVFGGCLPTCLADSDCGSGLSCDFSTGLCATNPKGGSAIGAVCDPTATNDPCAGFCVRVSDTQGMCSAGCSRNDSFYGCGFDGEDPAQAICAFTSLSEFKSVGDQGLCGALCDCNDDCKISGWGCFDIDVEVGSGAADYFQRPGVCLMLDTDTQPSDTLQECPAGSSGGSGGGGSGGKAGTGGTGSSGEGGDAATNSGGGGQGGSP